MFFVAACAYVCVRTYVLRVRRDSFFYYFAFGLLLRLVLRAGSISLGDTVQRRSCLFMDRPVGSSAGFLFSGVGLPSLQLLIRIAAELIY